MDIIVPPAVDLVEVFSMVNPGKLMLFTGGRFLVIQLSEIQMMSNLTPRKIRKVRKPSI